MKNNYTSTYNNICIGIVCVDSVLNNINKLSIPKLLLLIPILTHKDLVSLLKKNNSNVRCIEELIAKKQENFTNFNKRYYSFLSMSIDVIQIMEKLEIIRINDGNVEYIRENGLKNYEKLGERSNDIQMASVKLSKILEESESNLYLHLRVMI